MKVLIVNCVYEPEPVVSAQIAKDLAVGLAQLKHEVKVISPYPSRPSCFKFDPKYQIKKQILEEKIVDGATSFRLPSFVFPKSNPLGRLYEGLSFGYQSYRYLIKHAQNIDVVYMNTWPLFGQLGVALACKKKNLPFIVHIQDVYPESLTKKLPVFLRGIVTALLFPIEKYVTRNAKKILVISEKMKAYIASTRNIDAAKVEVVLNWQNEADFEEFKNYWPETTKPVYMYLGNIGPVAGLPLVIRAFVDAQIDAKLVLAGSGAKKEECMQIAKENPDCDIEFWEVPSGKVAATQTMANVLLLPMAKGTSTSSIPSKLPAYLFSARPIIVMADEGSDTGNAVLNAKSGWVGISEDSKWLTETFVKVNQTPATILKEMGQKGRSYCLQHFTKEINLRKLIANIING